ncbi:hypothetical protein [Nostoc sp.]
MNNQKIAEKFLKLIDEAFKNYIRTYAQVTENRTAEKPVRWAGFPT